MFAFMKLVVHGEVTGQIAIYLFVCLFMHLGYAFWVYLCSNSDCPGTWFANKSGLCCN